MPSEVIVVEIRSARGVIRYVVQAPIDQASTKALSSAVELGCALLNAPYQKDGGEDATRPVQQA